MEIRVPFLKPAQGMGNPSRTEEKEQGKRPEGLFLAIQSQKKKRTQRSGIVPNNEWMRFSIGNAGRRGPRAAGKRAAGAQRRLSGGWGSSARCLGQAHTQQVSLCSGQ